MAFFEIKQNADNLNDAYLYCVTDNGCAAACHLPHSLSGRVMHKDPGWFLHHAVPAFMRLVSFDGPAARVCITTPDVDEMTEDGRLMWVERRDTGGMNFEIFPTGPETTKEDIDKLEWYFKINRNAVSIKTLRPRKWVDAKKLIELTQGL